MNAMLGLLGLAVGIAVGVQFLKAGFNLGRSHKTYSSVGWILPGIMIGLLLLLIFRVQFSENGPIFFSAKGPGSMHAPLLISQGAGLLIGFFAQRTRFCTMGALRDVILMRDTHILGKEPSEVGLRLDEEFGILCRVGLHCSPASHKTIGSFPAGTVRFGLGFFNTADEVDTAIAAVRKLAEEER